MEMRRGMDVYYLMWGGALLAGEARRPFSFVVEREKAVCL